MRKPSTSRRLAIAALVLGVTVLYAPSANATAIPAASALLEGAVADLGQAGVPVDTSAIDPEIINQADTAIADANAAIADTTAAVQQPIVDTTLPAEPILPAIPAEPALPVVPEVPAAPVAPTIPATPVINDQVVADAVTAASDQAATVVEQADKAVADATANVNSQTEAAVADATKAVEEATANALADENSGDSAANLDYEGYQPIVDGPNYHWRYDPMSKFMAQRPFSERVLHRVSGSWFDQPDVPAASHQAEAEGASLYGPSTPVYVGGNQMCTIAATGYDKDGRKIAITAGHCGYVGAQVASADSWRVGNTGTVVAHGNGLDYSVIELGSNARVTRSYNGVTVNSVGGGTPAAGSQVCKSGVATGTTCGNVWGADHRTNVSQVCAMPGDSGAPVMEGDRLVGMVSGGTIPNYAFACYTPWQGGLFMPTMSTNMQAVVSDMDSRGGPGAGFRLPDS